MTNQQKLASAFNSLSAAGAALATHSGETPTYVHAKVIVTTLVPHTPRSLRGPRTSPRPRRTATVSSGW